MGLTSNFNPLLAKKILSAYRNGISPSTICVRFGLSEKNFKDLKLKYADQFNKANKSRAMNQKKIRNRLKTNLHGKKVETSKTTAPKATDEDRIRHLESLIEAERKKNKELEALLKVAKDHLGKF